MVRQLPAPERASRSRQAELPECRCRQVAAPTNGHLLERLLVGSAWRAAPALARLGTHHCALAAAPIAPGSFLEHLVALFSEQKAAARSEVTPGAWLVQ